MSLTKASYSMIQGAPVNILDYGADPTGVADSTAAIQAAVDAGKSIFIPAGTFKITAPITLSQNIFEITGIKGKSILMGSGGANIFGYFRVVQQFFADFGVIDGLTFDSDDSTKSRWAIYSPSDVYISHWRISECNFNGRLTGGIVANLIACHVYRCYFGVYQSGSGNDLKAIQSIGSVADVATTNINVIEQCEFASCGTPNAIVEFVTGYKVVFRDCIFEQLAPTDAVVLLSGIAYPVFEGCWFENAQGTTGSGKSVIWTRKDANNISCEVLTVDNCLFHTYNTIPDGLINFGDSIRKVAHFTKNFMLSLQSPVIVGGNSVATFVDTFGNYATVGSGGNATGLQYDSPAKFDLGVNAKFFQSDTSTTQVANSATTIYTFPTVAGETRFYMVSVASYQGAAASFGAFAIINTDLGTANIQIANNEVGMTLSLSGMALQATTNSVTPIAVECSVVRIK